MYAIFKCGAQQFKAEKGEELTIPYLAENKKGDELIFNEVLLVQDGDKIQIGNPSLSNASVKAKLIAHIKDKKVIIQKFRRRKRYDKRTGHRQNYSKIVITDIVV
ncbi:MAG TPA: 50S ribosomal protein L21 [bacterium]|nr:50S ribosomal protein L21 [bacterium]HPP86468.1 50S ribosomal protein L21 [bacterium]